MSSLSQELWSIYCQSTHHLSSEDISSPKEQAQLSCFLCFYCMLPSYKQMLIFQVVHLTSCLMSISVQISLLLTIFDCDLLRKILLLPTKSVLVVFEKGICDYHPLTLLLYFVRFHLCFSPLLSLVTVFI